MSDIVERLRSCVCVEPEHVALLRDAASSIEVLQRLVFAYQAACETIGLQLHNTDSGPSLVHSISERRRISLHEREVEAIRFASSVLAVAPEYSACRSDMAKRAATLRALLNRLGGSQ